MDINKEIDNTINRLAAVFMSKNIPVMPLSDISFFDIDCVDSGLYILELIDQLETLLGKYYLKTDKFHKRHKYYKKFKELYIENVEDGYLLPRPAIR